MNLSSFRNCIFKVRHGFRGVPRQLDPFVIRFDESLRRWNLDSELEVRQMLQMHLNPGDIFIDIGANFGMHTLYAAKKVGENGKVFAFEPIADNIKLLQRHIQLNQVQSQVVIEPSAVSNSQESQLSFFASPDACSVTASLQKSNDEQTCIHVQNTRLDDFWLKYNQPIKLVKVDVEGAELEVLKGAKEILKIWQPLLLIEVHGFAFSSFGTSLQEFRDYLSQFGYQEFRLSINDPQNDDYFQALYRVTVADSAEVR